jgi:large subunit ribosomal protein L17
MLRNQATALLRHEHLTTTVPRAKELRPFVERLITIAKRGVSGDGDGRRRQAAGNGTAKALNARRLVMRDLQDREVVTKLFDTLAARFESRPGGYTRLLRLGFRKGDATEIAQVELVGSEFNPRGKAETEGKEAESTPKQKGVGGRLRAAAQRLRGKKGEAEESVEEKSGKRAAGKSKAGAKKTKKEDGDE